MSEPISAIASVAALRDVPTKIAEILAAYERETATIVNTPRLPMKFGEGEQSAAEEAFKAEMAALKQQTLADLQRLENMAGEALTDARDRLETAILPVMSTDSHVQRVFELRQVRALAQFIALLDRAETQAAVDQAVRRFADDAARQSDWAALQVMLTQTAPYLVKRGMNPATSEALRIIDGTVALVRPKSAVALAERQALEQGAGRVAEAFAEARDAVDLDKREVRLPGYAADSFENITLPAVEWVPVPASTRPDC